MQNEKRTLKLSEIVGYGAGGMFTYGFQLMVTGYYLMYFMTDVAGFPAALAASLYSGIQVVKMVTMLFSGVIIDSVNFKSGKYRTWVLVAGIGLGIFFPLSFFCFPLSQAAYAVIFMIVYTLQTLCYNVGWTAMRAVIGKIAKNKADVVQLNTAAQSAGTISSILYGYIGYPILGIALWAGTKQAYFGASCIYGATIIMGAIYLFMMCGKYENAADAVSPVKQKRVGFFEMFKALKGPMVPFFASYSFSAASAGFYSTLLVYFTTYVLNDAAASALSLSWNAVAGLVGCLITPWLVKRMSKKSIHVWGMILSAVGYVMLAMFGRSAIPFIVIRALINVVGCPSTVVMSAMCNDIGDNIEMQGKEAPRAFLQGLTGSTTRVGLILSSTIASFSLAAIGYVAGVEFTESMINSMIVLIAVGPAIVCVLAAACMLFYRLDEKKIAEYNATKYAAK